METLKLRTESFLIFAFSMIFSFGVLGLWIVALVSDPMNISIGFLILLSIFLALIFGPPIVLSITYFIEDINKTVILNHETGELIIVKKRERYIIRKKEIIDCFHVKVHSHHYSKFQFPYYEYILIILKGRRRFYITNLICKPGIIIGFLRLHPELIDTRIPFIDRKMGELNLTKCEFEDKVGEFYKNFSSKTDEELLQICRQSDIYADYAIGAARKLLQERNKKVSKGNGFH